MSECPSTAGLLRRIRRVADMSQRQLAAAAGISASTLAHAETGGRDLPSRALATAAAVAGLRLALLDAEGAEVPPMDEGAVRDGAGRQFPAHLDTRHSDQGWWHGPERYTRQRPWYTFDRDRAVRDAVRRRGGTPPDHQLPRPGDSPEDRSAARRREADRRRAEERQRAWAAGLLAPQLAWECDCPPGCAELEDWSGPPRHVAGCPCRCDPC